MPYADKCAYCGAAVREYEKGWGHAFETAAPTGLRYWCIVEGETHNRAVTPAVKVSP